jgi:flagellar basal-body rod protein FlgC
MSIFNSMKITASALTAERYRMDIALQNIANANTTRTESGEPYRRKQVVFEERQTDFGAVLGAHQRRRGRIHRGNNLGGVRVTEIVESQAEFVPVYDPNHPDANEDGYVMYPNVNTTEERVDLMAAATAYDANLAALGIVKNLALKALEIGK